MVGEMTYLEDLDIQYLVIIRVPDRKHFFSPESTFSSLANISKTTCITIRSLL